MASGKQYEAFFFTATILEWKPLLADDTYKDIIINSLQYLVVEKRIQLNAFVIMNNHMHLLLHILHPHKIEDVQRDFLKYTAQIMLKGLRTGNTDMLNEFYVGAKDRKYQIWERNSLSIPIWSEAVLKQKLEYIHNNPVRAGLCAHSGDYKYSSAKVYYDESSEWDFVTPFYSS